MPSAKNPFLSYHLPLYAWMSVIFMLSSIPKDRLPEEPFKGISSIVHFIEYAILGALLARVLAHSRFDLTSRWLIVISVALAALYGASDELHQYFVPGRQTDIVDWTVDLFGALMGVALFRLCSPSPAR